MWSIEYDEDDNPRGEKQEGHVVMVRFYFIFLRITLCKVHSFLFLDSLSRCCVNANLKVGNF